MTDRIDEQRLAQLLRSLETNAMPDDAVQARTKQQTLDLFDSAVRGGSAEAGRAIGIRPTDTSAAIVELADDAHPMRRINRQLALVAVLLAVVGLSAVALFRDEGSGQTLAGETLNSTVGDMTDIDASNVTPGLKMSIEPDVTTVKHSDRGIIVLELTGHLSPDREPTDLTIIAVDRWHPPPVAPSVPRVEIPDSLAKWLGISGVDLSTFVPLDVPAASSSDSWTVTVGPGASGCSRGMPCADVASSGGGDTISLIAGSTNELTSIELPDGSTLLAHVVYRGTSALDQPVGAEILQSLSVS